MQLDLTETSLRAYIPESLEESATLKAKLFHARAALVDASPFLGALVLKLPVGITDDPRMKTACVDLRGMCNFDVSFLRQLNSQEVRAVLLHETLHLALDVFGRLGERVKEIWNIAHDLAINLLIEQSELPKDFLRWPEAFPPLLDPAFKGLSAEEIYERVEPNCTYVIVPDLWFQGQWPGTETADLQDKWRQALVEAAETALRSQSWGTLPLWVQKILGPLLRPQVPWQQALAHRVHGHLKGRQRSYIRPGRRSHAVGEILPGVRRNQGVAGVFIDVSGSISSEQLGLFLGELRGILTDADVAVRLLTWDAAVKEDFAFDNASDLDNAMLGKSVRWVGGGGTSPECLIPYLLEPSDKPDPTFGILLTDGECIWPKARDWPFELIVVTTHELPPEGYEFLEVHLETSRVRG